MIHHEKENPTLEEIMRLSPWKHNDEGTQGGFVVSEQVVVHIKGGEDLTLMPDGTYCFSGPI
jgi:hypothetical protein